MNERNRNTEQLDADTPSKEKTGIRVRIELGKRFCIFVVALVILVAGVFLAARFVPRDTPVGVYRAQLYACMHEGAKAMFVRTMPLSRNRRTQLFRCFRAIPVRYAEVDAEKEFGEPSQGRMLDEHLYMECGNALRE